MTEDRPSRVQNGVAVPPGKYDVWADDDDVIGLTVAKTYPKGLPVMRTEPPFMDAFDEIAVGQFVAWCLENAEAIMQRFDPVLDILRRTAPVSVTVCPTCGGSGTGRLQ